MPPYKKIRPLFLHLDFHQGICVFPKEMKAMVWLANYAICISGTIAAFMFRNVCQSGNSICAA
jgi:hypothetical protein